MEDPPRAAASAMMHSNDRPCHSPPALGRKSSPGRRSTGPSWEHSVRGGNLEQCREHGHERED